MRTLIVDDEYPARQELRFLLKAFPYVEVVGEATNAGEAMELIRALDYSILFLDIQMPGLSGLELAKSLQEMSRPPAVVFTTAYEEYACQAFEVNAVDYLLKPFDEARLGRALRRAMSIRYIPAETGQQDGTVRTPDGEPHPARRESPRSIERIPVLKADRTMLVDIKDVVYAFVDNERTYVRLYKESFPVPFTLSELESRLRRYPFLRTHRKYLVNLLKVKEVFPYFKGRLGLVMEDASRSEITVSRSRGKALRQKLGMS